jgi:subtilisin family serine protease
MHSPARSGLVPLMALAILSACSGDREAPLAPDEASKVSSTSSMYSGVPNGRTVVVFRDTASIPMEGMSLIGSLGGTVVNRFDEIGVAVVRGLSVSSLAALRDNPLVLMAGSDRILNWLPGVTIRGVVDAGASPLSHRNPATARYFADGTQWNMRITGADKAWAAGLQGTPSTRVAILDTGIDYTNRDLAGRVDLAASRSFTEIIVCDAGPCVTVPADEPQQPGDAPYMDNHFHGTHVASTVSSNSISVAPIAPHVTLVAVKVLNFLGSGTFESVASGILYAARDAGAQVINMSLGADVDTNEDGVPALLEFMRRTIRQAEKYGTIVISAAGNDGLDLDVGSLVSTPCEQSTICVSATGPLMQQNFDQPAEYTNFGITAIHMAAPGGNASDTAEYVNQDLIIGACSTRTTEPGLAPCRASTDGVAYFYAYAAGTSMASPHVAGAAALVKSYSPTLSVQGLRARLLNSADDIGVKGRDVYSNHGRLNVWKALGGK